MLGTRLDEYVQINAEVHRGNQSRFKQEQERNVVFGGLGMAQAQAATTAVSLPVGSEPSEG